MNRLAQISLLVFAFVLPWEDSLLLPGIGSLGRVSGLLLLVFALPSLFRGNRLKLRLPSLFIIVMLLFVVWSSLSMFWSLDPGSTLTHAMSRVQLFALAFLVWQLVDRPERADPVMRAYVLGCYVAIGSAIFNLLTGTEYVYQRYSATGTDPNDFATMLALGIPMAWLLVVRGRQGIWFWPMLLYLPAVLGAILLTSSRGGAIVTLLALLVVPLTMRHLDVPRRLAFWFMVGVGGLGAIYAAPLVIDTVQGSIQRLSSTASEVASGTLNERADIWDAGFRLLEDNTMLGVGAGAFEQSVTPYAGLPKIAHNTYISVLVELGPLGLLLFVSALLAAALPLLRLPGPERAILLVLGVTLAVALVPLTWEIRKVTWFVLVLMTTYGTMVVAPKLRPAKLAASA